MREVDRNGVESVWDYPRPPRLEPTASELCVVHRGVVLGETRRGLRVLETSHPPVFYLPPEDVRTDLMRLSERRQSFCEFKGMATYWSLAMDGVEPAIVQDVAWSYPDPSAPFEALQGYLAFYANRVDECIVDGERVQPQEGDFYGGWITTRVCGPFKGAPGTRGW